MRLVLGVLEGVDALDELVGEARDRLREVDATPLDEPAAAAGRGTATAAGRIIVEAMSSEVFASMFWTLT